MNLERELQVGFLKLVLALDLLVLTIVISLIYLLGVADLADLVFVSTVLLSGLVVVLTMQYFLIRWRRFREWGMTGIADDLGDPGVLEAVKDLENTSWYPKGSWREELKMEVLMLVILVLIAAISWRGRNLILFIGLFVPTALGVMIVYMSRFYHRGSFWTRFEVEPVERLISRIESLTDIQGMDGGGLRTGVGAFEFRAASAEQLSPITTVAFSPKYSDAKALREFIDRYLFIPEDPEAE